VEARRSPERAGGEATGADTDGQGPRRAVATWLGRRRRGQRGEAAGGRDGDGAAIADVAASDVADGIAAGDVPDRSASDVPDGSASDVPDGAAGDVAGVTTGDDADGAADDGVTATAGASAGPTADADDAAGDATAAAPVDGGDDADGGAPRRRWRTVARTAAWASAVVAVAVVLLVFVFPTRTYLSQRRQLASTASELRLLTQQNTQLSSQVARLQTDTEIERLAREEYHLVRPGERAFAILPAPTPPTKAPPSRAAAAPARGIIHRLTSWIP
jgi:cell division protein FtsB